MSKYGHRTIHWFEGIVNKLGGEDAADDFLRGELKLATRPFVVCRGFKIGVYKNLDIVRQKLSIVHECSVEAGAILKHPMFVLSQNEQSVDLSVRTVRQLTGKKTASTQEVFNAIREIDGMLCPAEVGIDLRERDLGLKHTESVIVAMEPIGEPASIFVVGRFGPESKMWLHAERVASDRMWHGDTRFVFMFRPL